MDKNFLDTLSKDGDAYLICSAEDLCNLSEYVNAGNDCDEKIFKLANDIDLRGVENFTPIGTEKNLFAGTFDGAGKIISHLKIVGDNDGGTIENCTASGNVSGKENVGGLVSFNGEEIENCTASGNVDGKKFLVGGLVSFNGGETENCTASGLVINGDEII